MQSTRPDYCANGHPFDQPNTYVRPNGERNCRTCRREAKVKRAADPRVKAWNRWYDMVQRCTNPNHPNWSYYGGRGVTVCQEWLASFDSYYTFVGDPPFPTASVDRIDNDLTVDSYGPGNVRWATKREQSLNTRFDPTKHNQARKTHCPQGHEYTGANLYIAPKTGDRMCRTCRRQHQSSSRAA